jgi:hypothetical protein
MSKYQVITTLHLCDEEGCGQSFAPDGELHQCNSFGRNRLASFNTADHHVGLDQLIIHATKILLKRIWHQVHNRLAINQHVVDWYPIDMAFHMQWFEVVNEVFQLLEKGTLSSKIKLCYP